MRGSWITAATLLLAAGTASAQSAADGRFASRFRFGEREGGAIWHNVCAGCHMADARGAAGAGAYPSLADDARLADARYPIHVVLHGLRAMPPLGFYLDDEQVAAVVTYLRTSFGNDFSGTPGPGDVARAR